MNLLKLLKPIFLIFCSSPIFAAPAQPIWQFDVLAVTSAQYNPILPSPLTPDSALTMAWDIVSGSSQFKTSNQTHGGGWLAFVTETGGYRIGSPIGKYSAAPIVYFGSVNVVNTSNTVIGFYDEFYCSPCNPGGIFSATTTSINTGKNWYAQMYVR